MLKKINYILAATLLVWSCSFIYSQAYLGFSQGQILGDATSAAYPYPSGSLVNDSGTIYFIFGTNKIPFTSWPAFVGLGYSLKNVSKGDLANYTALQNYVINTANAAHPWGSWLTYKNTVYYSAADGLIGVPSAEVFASNGGNWSYVVKANKYDLAILSSNPHLPVLTDNDSRITPAPAYQFAVGTSTQPETTPSPTPTGVQNTPTPTPSPISNTSSGPGTLNMPTLASSSPPSQFVFGSTINQLIANLNFTASGSPVTIQELDFTVVGGTVVPITSVNVNGQIDYLNGATSSVAGLNIVVPAGGITVPVTVNFPVVSPNNAPTNQAFTLNLTVVKYLSGGTTSYLYPNLASNSMDLVANAPSVALISSAQALTDNNILIAKIKVSANGGNIILNQLPLVITSSGGGFVVATSSNVLVTDDNGGFPDQVSYGSFGLGAGGSSSLNITFNSDNAIAGNSSKTYDVYIPVEGPLGNPGSSSVTTTLGASSGLTYTDPTGGPSGQNIPGGSGSANYILNYPTTGVSVHN